MNIERDGIIDEIYYLLWKKQDWIKGSEEFFKLNIPDTLIIKRNTPFSWYFTNKDGFLMRKKVKSMGLDNVYKIFSGGNKTTGISAFFVQMNQRKAADERFRKFFNLNDDKDIKDDKLVVEYFTPETLHKFLFEDQREKSGILQKFLEPKGLNNNMIEIIWSPSICLMSKKYNTRSIYEKKYDVYERCVTYEGPEFYSRYITLKSPIASQELRQIVHKIVKRIALVSLERMVINRLVLYFKQHNNGEYYFLYSSSLRVDQGKNKTLKDSKSKHNHPPMQFEHIFEMPGYVKKLYTIDTKKPRQLICDVQCNLCKKFYQKGDMVQVALKYIIKEEFYKRNYMKIDKKPPSKPEIVPVIIDQEKEEKNLGEDNLLEDRYGIPMILQKLFPQLTNDDYCSLMKDERFRMKTIPFCYSCFIELTKNEKLSGINIVQGRSNDELIRNYISANSNLKEIHVIEADSFVKDKFLRDTKAKAIEQKSFKEQIGLKYSSPKIDTKLLPDDYLKEPIVKNIQIKKQTQSYAKKTLSVASISTKEQTGSLASRPQTANNKLENIRKSLDRPRTAVPQSVQLSSKTPLKIQVKRNLSSANNIRSSYVVKDEFDVFFNEQYKTLSQQLEDKLNDNDKRPKFIPNFHKTHLQDEGHFRENLDDGLEDDDLFEAKEKLFRDLDRKEDISLENELLIDRRDSSSPEESDLFEEMHRKMVKDVLRKDDKYLDSDEFISDF